MTPHSKLEYLLVQAQGICRGGHEAGANTRPPRLLHCWQRPLYGHQHSLQRLLVRPRPHLQTRPVQVLPMMALSCSTHIQGYQVT